jgi:OOP family OmpA-OmpF porin
MSRWLKLLIGGFAALAAGAISHGPLGRGEAFVAMLEAKANEEVRRSGLPGVQVRMERSPLSRRAVLTGNANDFQREGMGQLPGINDRVSQVPGISGIRWDDTDCCARR